MKTLRKRNLGWKGWLNRLYRFPCLFWISSSDGFIKFIAHIGLLSSLLGLVGFYPPLCSFISLMVYLSFKVIGQPWLGLQMHATVIEGNFAYLLGKSLEYWNPFVLVFIFRFLTWRVMLGCGAVKYGTGDKTWRDGTAMHLHFYTQPLPNSFTHFFHYSPD